MSEHNLTIEVPEGQVLTALLWGPEDAHRRLLERKLGLRLGARGGQISMRGPREAVDFGQRTLTELIEVLRGGASLTRADIEHSIGLLKSDPKLKLSQATGRTLITTHDRRAIRPKTPNQRTYVDAIMRNDLVFAVGPAGTGKTYLAMAAAVAALKRREVKRIVLARPAVEAGERLGFLPGTLSEKVNPYLQPLHDALFDLLNLDHAQRLIENRTIEVAPLAFMRGRTLNKSFVILDEAQNTTREQMKMFLTRLGHDSSAIVTGDVTQVDLARGQRSGLAHAVQLLDGIEGIQVVHLEPVDVVRHPLVAAIVRAYQRDQPS